MRTIADHSSVKRRSHVARFTFGLMQMASMPDDQSAPPSGAGDCQALLDVDDEPQVPEATPVLIALLRDLHRTLGGGLTLMTELPGYELQPGRQMLEFKSAGIDRRDGEAVRELLMNAHRSCIAR
jgi:hypothetical protein